MIRVHSRLFAALFFAGSAFAGILPQRLGDFALVKAENYTPADQALYKEYGFDAGEQGQYAAGDRKLDITVIRASDPTGAFGIYEWMRPAGGKQITMGDRAVEAGDVTCFQFGNYVIVLKGSEPEEDPLAAMLSILPRFEQTAAPPLLRYMPADGRIANSERYILGPVALAKLVPAIPPSAVGFHAGAEGQQAEYQAAGGRLTMTLFSYPTPHLARAQIEEIQKLPNVMAKRSVSLIGVVVNPFSPDEAEKLLAKVHYQATLTMSEKTTNSRKENVGDLILNIIFLCGIIAGLALMGGIAFGGGRVLLGKLFPGKGYDTLAEREFIRLHLDDE
jgi:hypothetical protein